MTGVPLQLWGGAEYTCNRVEDAFHDQISSSGHEVRLGDFAAFASLGLKTIRFGLLWEHYERDLSWDWGDSRLNAIRELGINPIIGLLHHGSGPAHTSLLDPGFPQKLAEYAGKVAERYPWVTDYTPVNEPNTTARFSALYGIWYPHHRSLNSYLTALLHQLRATVLSMRAIRLVQPAARLIQTEDLGTTWSTPGLSWMRDLMEHRRWLTFDLLCGEVDRDHPLFRYMRSAGISEASILWFLDNPCPPDMLGINYYVTSDRFLDERVEDYPAECGSIEGPFVDIEAARSRAEGIAGFERVITEAWTRYHLPVAITEVHLGDRSEEQIRWLAEAWEGAQRARAAGVDCRAVTVWAMLGSFCWDVLVTRRNDHYEAGAFDVLSGVPVRTELADVMEQLTRGDVLSHPALSQAGWWRRDDRIAFHPGERQPDPPLMEEVTL